MSKQKKLRAIRAWLRAAIVCSLGVATMNAAAWSTLDAQEPVVIAHRGASGYRPEHTLASYSLAIEMGADFIEPDLVATRDGHLIARHEPLLDETTDVTKRAEFAKRRSTKNLDGKPVTGFFASDFTLAEIKQLRAIQSNAARSKEFDGQFEVPTFEEILDLLQSESTKRQRKIGVYPETKHPAFHLGLNLPLEDRLLDALQRRGLDHADAPVFIQSFESANLQYLQSRTKVKLVQLFDEKVVHYDSTGTRVAAVRISHFGDPRGGALPHNMADIAKYAYAVGPWKGHIMRENGKGALLRTNLIDRAHAAGLRVHAYTFRSEPARLAPEYQNEPQREYFQFFDLGIDGVFSDFPDTALKARVAYSDRKK